jgi:membrane protease YdiL (CAAX protease family)
LSDFIIVLAVGILGLLAQAAGGKRVRRLVTVHLNSVTITESASHTESLNSASSASAGAGGAANPAAAATAPAEVKAASEEPNTDVKSAINAPSESAVAKSVAVEANSEASAAHPAEAKPEDAETKSETAESNSDGAEAKFETTESKSEGAEQISETAEVKPGDAGNKSETAATSEGAEAKSETTEAKSEAAEAKSETAEAKTGASGAEEAKSGPAQLETAELKSETADAESAGAQPKSEPSSAAVVNVTPVSPPVVQETFVVTRKPAIEWFLRVVISLWFLGLSLFYYISSNNLSPGDFTTSDPWVLQVTFVTCALTGLGLVKGFRAILSYALSAVDCVFDIKLLKSAVKSWDAVKPAFAADRVFIPSSIPHMVALFIYVQTMFYLLSAMTPKSDFQMPGLPLPMPLPLDQLFSYNGLGLVMLAFCGSGIFVTRSFKEVLSRLALVKPTPPQIMIGLGLVFMSFMYDWIWSFYTHGQHLGLDAKLAGYNGGTFTATGGFTGALVLALATAIFAGVGEETLIRGALQPVFGLVPAAILHGVLHAQFQHAPIFIVQVAGWSVLMGIAKRYTNTSTTIIGHAGFNFVTTFLFAYNPPDVL